MFIFCCFTGLAYIDLKNLTYDHIVTTPTGEQYIYNRRQKTGTPYHIMLLPIAQEFIERYRGYPGKIDETRVFPVKSRKSMCTTIKRIAQKCGITKNLSTHIGRHTFGTTVTLEKGVPIETVSEMLGHKQITTTQIYAKLTANKMKEDVRLLTQRIGNLYELTPEKAPIYTLFIRSNNYEPLHCKFYLVIRLNTKNFGETVYGAVCKIKRECVE